MKPKLNNGIMLYTYLNLYNITMDLFAQYMFMSKEDLEILLKQSCFDVKTKQKVEYVLNFSFEEMKNDPYVYGGYQVICQAFQAERFARIADGEEILRSAGFIILKQE